MREKNRWLLAQYHKPAWPAVKGPSGAFKNWVPLFEKYRLDLVVAGHAHAYERGRQNGVMYVVVGGAGGRLDDDPSGEWPFFKKLVPKHKRC